MTSFSHPALSLQKKKPLVYTALSKHLFYFRMHISKFVFEQGCVPLNPFLLSDYFLLDTVDRDLIREANNTLIRACDEVWIFGDISNGVLAEIKIAHTLEKNIQYFKIIKSQYIVPTSIEDVDMEEDVKPFKEELSLR